MAKHRKFWGWGFVEDDLTDSERTALARNLADRFGSREPLDVTAPPSLEEIRMPPSRVSPPAALRGLVTDDRFERASHAHGMSYRDVVLAYRRDFSSAPDWVALPRTEDHIRQLLEWCADADLVAIPYGGGTSVVGGVEPPVDGGAGSISIDMRHFDQVVEVDRTSRAALIQAGATGPGLEAQLRPHAVTLRHFPQSFEMATLGGWIVTRSGGHFATLYTHIDEFVEAVRMVTPAGVMETRRLPGSGAGPQPERLVCGSEGVLGIVTQAWMRLQDRPTFRANLSAEFVRFEDAVEACRAVSQSGLNPANCRLLNPEEALYNGAGDGSRTLLLIAFESADHPLETWIGRSAELCRDHRGEVPDPPPGGSGEAGAREGSAGAWRDAFIKMPYRRDALAGMGVLSETFETACTWDRFERFHATVTRATRGAMDAVGARRGWISMRFTHVYPDGPAPYYSVTGPATRGEEIEQWQAIKDAASEAIMREGGTITHHHAVGRDHSRWYREEAPALFLETLRAAKSTLDPAGVLNRGVLFGS
jgi:alkyldihydroxyacetonephosphate synthase